jgi:hypothetical protein
MTSETSDWYSVLLIAKGQNSQSVYNMLLVFHIIT